MDAEPHGGLEHELVERIAGLQWRLRRAVRYEVAVTAQQLADTERDVTLALRNHHPGRRVRPDDELIAAISQLRIVPPDRELDLIMRYETALHRAFTRALHELQVAQDRRKSEREWFSRPAAFGVRAARVLESKCMANTVTLSNAAGQFLETLPPDELEARRAEVQRFVRWAGADRTIDQLRGQEVANYAEMLTGGVADPSARAETVRAFLAFAKKSDLTSSNLGTHLRLRKSTSKGSAKANAVQEVQLSEAEHSALADELASLKAQRPKILQDIQRALSDRDLRENAPLDAARQQQSYMESRIRTIEATLGRAVIVTDAAPAGESVGIGSTVVLRNLANDAETRYTLVRPGEVNAGQGRISYESPVGQALLQRRAGDEVEVKAPSGTHRFKVEQVEA
jgi:transcription elongation factor GreA